MAVDAGKKKQAAQQFIEVVMSAEGQVILQKYGFTAAAEK